MLLGYFRRGGLVLSFIGAVVIALLVTAGTRARIIGLGRSLCACAACDWMGAGVGEGVGLCVGVGFSDAGLGLGLGLGAGCDGMLVVLSRSRENAFASRLPVVLVGREV